MGTPRPVATGELDTLNRQIKVSGQTVENRSTAPAPGRALDDGEDGVSVVEVQYIGGGSDKFYRVETDGCAVTITYGRNGTPGTTDTKTFPDEAAAAAFAAKKLKEKITKGYRPVDAPTGTSADTAVFDDILADRHVLPMLAKVADPADITRMLDDDRWVLQPKLDGDRVVIAVRDGKLAAFNRQGQPKARNVGQAHLDAFAGLDGDWTFDGEMVGRTFHVFDLASAPGLHDESPYERRRELLESAVAALGADPEVVRLVPTVKGRDAKIAYRRQAQQDRREGVMFRHVGGVYDNGRRSTDLVKDKFWSSADVVVTAVHPHKESVEVSVRGRDGRMRPVGNITTIGKGDIKVGSVVEAKFLYVTDADNPVLYQPEILRVRADKTADECDLDQFIGTDTNRDYDLKDQP